MKPFDFDSRYDFSNLVLIKMEEQYERLHTGTDEEHFTFSGAVNTPNYLVWTTKTTYEFVAVPL